MNTVFIVILVLLVLGAILFGLYVMTYNKIQRYSVRIEEAEAEIDETLRKRLDILTNMEIVINDVTHLDQKNFSNLKSDTMTNFEMDRRLTKITNTFKKIKMDYNDELDIESYRDLLVDLKINEEKCDAAKSFYNKYTTELNLLIKKFPSNIVGKLHGVSEKMYFDNKNMKDDDIMDFKL